MMTFITLSCNHPFVTYITYKSSKTIAPQIINYWLNFNIMGR